MDSRKLDIVFYMIIESGNNLTFEEIEKVAAAYSARSLWYLWQHTKRYRRYITSVKE